MRLGTFLSIAILYAPYVSSQNMVITVPIASLRTSPTVFNNEKEDYGKASQDIFGRSYDYFTRMLPEKLRDPWQDTQLVCNENIKLLETLSDGWIKIELLEQYDYNKTNNCFGHIQGYIKNYQAQNIQIPYKANSVVNKAWSNIKFQDGSSLIIPMGTKLWCTHNNNPHATIKLADKHNGTIDSKDLYYITDQVNEPKTKIRSNIVNCAQQLVGGTYCWGGRSPYSTAILACTPSCDCSGLINLVYRANGLEIPRNANAIWLRSSKIKTGSKLLPGDLIFFAYPDRPDHVHHILLFIGNEMLIESCVAKGITLRTAQERLGKPVATIVYGDTIKTTDITTCEYLIYFGSYLNHTRRIQYMRDYALGNYNVKRWVHDEHKNQKSATNHTNNHLNK